MKHNKCIICNKIEYVSAFPFNTKFNDKIFEYKKCTNCKFVRIFPYPNKQDLDELYNNKSYHEKFYGDVNKIEYKESVKFLKKFTKSRVKILDYGSGNGDFINEIEGMHDCYGVEYSPDTIKILKKKFKNSTILDISEFENKKYNNFFDIVHLGDVLEHVTNPDGLLISMYEKIKKDGLLYVEGPLERNFSLVNISILLFGNLKKFIIPSYKNDFKPYHLYFCDFENQLLMFKKNKNFKIMEYMIYETGWPYNNGGYIKKLISLIAISLSKLNIFGLKIGNRFRIILQKK